MKSIVVYDSVHGNTRTVALELARQLMEMGYETSTVNIAEQDAHDVTCDLLCIGSPTRMKKATRQVKKFVKRLDPEAMKGTRIVLFDTIMALPDDPKEREKARKWVIVNAVTRMQDILAKKGLMDRTSSFHVEVTGMKGPLAPDFPAKISQHLASLKTQ